jgi:diaminopimelate epimerase
LASKFAKMVASGNDFIVIDNRDGVFDGGDGSLIERLCTRRMSVGADGVLLLERDPDLDFAMKYFNSDGREASMCGNGGRCMALFAHLLGITGREVTFRAKAGIYRASIDSVRGEDAAVTLSMPDPTGIRPKESLRIGEETLEYGAIDTGVPHVVLIVDDLESIDVPATGRRIRRHSSFVQKGTNVDFIKVAGERLVRVRTYERGVEDETLSCGTGAVASAILASIWTGMQTPITVRPASGEDLHVSFERNDLDVRRVALHGGARVVYRGVISEP